MKKRKKPVVLVTVLVVLIAVACALNMYSNSQPKSPEEAAQMAQREAAQKQDTLGKSREAADKTSVASKAAAALGGATPQAAKKMPPGVGPDGPGGPSIAKPRITDSKPKPNDSMIQGQWYSKEHMGSGN